MWGVIYSAWISALSCFRRRWTKAFEPRPYNGVIAWCLSTGFPSLFTAEEWCFEDYCTVYTFLLEMGSFFRGYVSAFLGVEGLLAELSRHFNPSAGNVLNCQIPGHCQTVVGNIPYRISSALISKLLRQEPPLQRIAARHGAWAAGARIVL